MPISRTFSEFDPPRQGVGALPSDVAAALLRIGRVKDAPSAADIGEGRPSPKPDGDPYFEIYRAERVSLTSILFSGGDWHWRFCSASGIPVAVSTGYASERACMAAVATLRSGAGAAMVRTPSRRSSD